jgi:hypothetical protein
VVINVLVEVKGLKYVERMSEIDLAWNGRPVFENRQQMRGTDDGIDVDHGHDPGVTICAVVRFKYPQAIVRVRISEGLAVFMDKGTLIYLVPEHE